MAKETIGGSENNPKFEAWVDKVMDKLSSYPPQRTELVNFLRGYWNQHSHWTKEPGVEQAADAFGDDRSKKKDLMKRLKNDTEYNDVKEPDGYLPGQFWCDVCDGYFEKAHKHQVQ